VIQAIAGIYMFVGMLAVIGGFVFFTETGTFLGPLSLAAGGIASLASGLLLGTLGDLLQTTQKILAVLESNSSPTRPNGSAD
jgi:hypothetical protein